VCERLLDTDDPTLGGGELVDLSFGIHPHIVMCRCVSFDHANQ
jgi:hypothetical protein